MKILVCLKQVPSSKVINFDEQTGLMKRDSNEVKLNPIDLFSIEAALKIKEELGGEVVAVTMGPPSAKAVIEEAVSLGADNGFVFSDRKFASSDLLATSNTLKNGIEAIGDFDLVICGKESSDGATGGLAGELGERLGVPTIHSVSEILSVQANSMEVIRMADEFSEKIEFKLPALISVVENVNDPRFPNYFDLLKSEEMEVKVLSLEDFNDKDENNYGAKGSRSVINRVFKSSGEKQNESNVNAAEKVNEVWTGNDLELATRLENKLKEMKFL